MEPSSAAKKTPRGSRRKARQSLSALCPRSGLCSLRSRSGVLPVLSDGAIPTAPRLISGRMGGGLSLSRRGAVQKARAAPVPGQTQKRWQRVSASAFLYDALYDRPHPDGGKAAVFAAGGVPFEALAYVFGRDPMYWYRAYVSLERPVGRRHHDQNSRPLADAWDRR